MNRKSQLITALLTVSALSITALTGSGFAKQLDTQDSAGKLETPSVSFSTQGFASTGSQSEQALDVLVPAWSLGPIGFDTGGGNLKVASVNSPAFLKVNLKEASGGATADRLKLVVTADANTPKGEYPVEVVLENKQFGDSGSVTVMVTVE
jgi:hypothetical protein